MDSTAYKIYDIITKMRKMIIYIVLLCIRIVII